jgi:hypothetical protein
MVKRLLWAASGAFAASCALSAPASADLTDWQVSPLTTEVGSAELTVGGSLDGSLFDANQPAHPSLDERSATGMGSLYANLMRTYDTGLVIGLKSSFELFHDRLSGDNYGSDFVQKVYGQIQFGLGRVEIGNTDGAAYTLAVTGPVVDNVTTLDNANTTFYLDPLTDRAFTEVFAINSAVESTLNYAKISYYTPRLFGVQFGASFTPNEGKGVIPFVKHGPQVPNRQVGMWEMALSYQGSSGRLSYGASAAIALGHAAAKTPGHHGLTDWAFGVTGDYDLSDDMKVSLGGAYRQSNQYTFDINNVLAMGGTNALHLSSVLTWGSFLFGGEFSTGSAEGSLGFPDVGMHGYEASVGYMVNTNLQLTAGWQELIYAKNPGLFYNGAPKIEMDAGFLHLNFHI